MNPKELPVVGQLINPTGHDFFGQYSDLTGKRLLCIGFSEQEIDKYIAQYNPAKIVMLTNWVNHVDAQVNKYELVFGDITRRTSFEDNSFDAVLTLSVLEHLLGLSDAFSEMTRITRRGGEMLHMFGPAWSCAYGHHLYANASDPNLNFVSWSLPAHIHLLCNREEIRQYYLDLGYSEETCESVLQWFFDTPLINRAFYDEYTRVMESSNLQIDKLELMYNDLPRSHLQLLMRAFPNRRDFSTYGGRYRLIVAK